MTFKVIDKKTGKEPTNRVIHNIAKKQGLMEMDIDQFFLGEDGQIVLADDCGRIAYLDMERFEVIPQMDDYIDSIAESMKDEPLNFRVGRENVEPEEFPT